MRMSYMEPPLAEIFVKLPAPRMLSMTMMMTGKGGRATVVRQFQTVTEKEASKFTANIAEGET